MTYFSRQFSAEIPLPDGTVASSAYEVDRYLKANQAAYAADYSAEYMQSIRQKNERNRRDELFAEFINNYKKEIWNE